jgi:uncharacterized membrane protein
MLAGISFAIGYGIGVALAYLLHRLPERFRFRLSYALKKTVVILLCLVAVVFVFLGFHWQQQVRTITASTAVAADYPLRVILIATLFAALLIWMSRGIAHFGRYLGNKLDRILPRKVATYGGGILAAIILIYLVNGVLIGGVFGAINYVFGLTNGSTPPGIHQPQTGDFSGTPDSAIDWNTLGEKGREFVASGPSQNSIASFGGAESKQPSRLYVGLESASSLQERVDLLVKELDRTDAKDRQAVLIAIPTGSGGVDAKSVETVEYLYHGDTTTLAIQYSYLPSWISFLADQAKVRDAGKAVTEATYDWWSHLDPAHRPKLLMYGESLGTLGADGAFSGAADMHARMNGVLLAGPPNANHLWSGIVADRDAGTREVLPTYKQGEVVRFTDATFALSSRPSGKPWEQNRVGFSQHGSDPVVWWSPALLLHKPDWLKEERGSDVLPNMRWYPFVTFWQVAGDLPFAFGAPDGHGHRYGNTFVPGWTDVLDIRLGSDQTAQLTKIIDAVK